MRVSFTSRLSLPVWMATLRLPFSRVMVSSPSFTVRVRAFCTVSVSSWPMVALLSLRTLTLKSFCACRKTSSASFLSSKRSSLKPPPPLEELVLIPDWVWLAGRA
ncbi:hypothetical protein D3C81_1688310 [compost metagenome]